MNFNKPTAINHIKEDRPAFRILSERGFFGPDDTLYPQDSEIYFEGKPNEEMEPLNEKGRLALEAYLEELDRMAREVSEKTGKNYSGRPRNIDGGLEMATAVQRSEMNIFGKSRDETKVAKIDSDPVAETGTINPNKRGRGRPRKGELAA